MIVETTKIEITKVITYDNGFQCKYRTNEFGDLDSYYFTKNELPYHNIPDIETLQKTILNRVSMQSEWGEKHFPKFKHESELISFSTFDNLYHMYFSNNYTIIDGDGKHLSTCVQLDDWFLSTNFGFLKKKKDYIKEVGEFYEIVKTNSVFSELHTKDDGTPYSIQILLQDEDFMKLLDKYPKRIHEHEAMYFIKDIFKEKIK